MKTLLFKVKLTHDKRVWRTIELLGSQTLDDLHGAIQAAFDFDADHLYSFFMSGKAWDLSDFEYHHPDADPQTPLWTTIRTLMATIRGIHPEPRRPATAVRLDALHLKPKQRFLYLFDYGDEWRFDIEFVAEGTPETADYPRLVDARGEAPAQYTCDDDEDRELPAP